MMRNQVERRTGGLPRAIGAYLIWGLLTFYLKQLRMVPPLELVGWRIVFTLPPCLVAVVATRQGAALASRRTLALPAMNAMLIVAIWAAIAVFSRDLWRRRARR